MSHPVGPPKRKLRLSYERQIFLMAAIPMILAAAAIALIVAGQARNLAEQEITALENQLISAKKAELKNYLSLARTAIVETYGRALPDDQDAMTEVAQTLAAMIYGQDGFFFVYDYDGNNLVSPRQTYLINRNWSDVENADGIKVADELIALARQGSGYLSYSWNKPSTGEVEAMVSYVVGLQDWRWAIGTGVFIDDVLKTVAAARAQTEARVQSIFFWITVITLSALLAVFLTGLVINIRERRLADAKLKELTQRVLDTQEQERGRVARELHDSISQILVGVRYMLELARRQVRQGDPKSEAGIEKSIEGLQSAISEVRRISRDLRPGVLDDLGLGPALKALVEEFSKRTGIESTLETAVFRNRLSNDAKIALYRIAQEALTNIERHAQASNISLRLRGHTKGATLRIQDDGIGLPKSEAGAGAGLGLRNMQERMEQLNGSLRIMSTRSGTVIEAQVPLGHLLPPESNHKVAAE